MTILGIIQLLIEVAAFLAALLSYKELRANNWVLWIPYLAITCIVEILGTYIGDIKGASNLWLYNPYIILSITFYGWFLISISILTKQRKTRLYVALWILSGSSLGWYIMWGDPHAMINYILNIGSVIICLLCLLFFYTQIRNPFHHISLSKAPGFWIAAGLLVFYTGISLYIAVYNFLARAQITILNILVQNLIPQALSLVLYTFIIIAFRLWKSPSRTSSTS